MSLPLLPEGARGGRTRAREVVFRALFEAEVSGDDPLDVLELAIGRFRFTADGREFAARLAAGLEQRRDEADAILRPLLKRWAFERLSGSVRSILRLAVVEILVAPESPPRVILNEAIRLANRYGEEDAGGFVNGVLDAAVRKLRPGVLDDARSVPEPDGGPGR